MDYDDVDDDDEDLEISAVPSKSSKKGGVKKSEGAKKKPKKTTGPAPAPAPAPAKAAATTSKAKASAQANLGSRRPTVGPVGAPSVGSSSAFKLKDPMSINFQDSDISVSDLEGDVEIGDPAESDESASGAPAPAPAQVRARGATSTMAAAKSLLSGGASCGSKPMASQAHMPEPRAPAAAKLQKAQPPAVTLSAAQAAEDSFERELARELDDLDVRASPAARPMLPSHWCLEHLARRAVFCFLCFVLSPGGHCRIFHGIRGRFAQASSCGPTVTFGTLATIGAA